MIGNNTDCTGSSELYLISLAAYSSLMCFTGDYNPNTTAYYHILPHTRSHTTTYYHSLSIPRIESKIVEFEGFIVTLIPGIIGNSLVLVSSVMFNAINLDDISVQFVRSIALADLIYNIIVMLPQVTFCKLPLLTSPPQRSNPATCVLYLNCVITAFMI